MDCANGASSRTAPSLFQRLECETDLIFCQPDGININTGCGSTHIEGLQEFVKENHLDVGFAYDGDAAGLAWFTGARLYGWRLVCTMGAVLLRGAPMLSSCELV